MLIREERWAPDIEVEFLSWVLKTQGAVVMAVAR